MSESPTPRELEIQIRDNEKLTALALAQLEKRLEDRFAASQAAITKAETAAEKRFEAVNEFRGQLGDLVRTMLSRSEADQRDQGIKDTCEALRRDLTTVKEDARNQLFMTKEDLQKKIVDLIASRDTKSGEAAGRTQFWGILIAVIMASAVIVGLVLRK
jgi:hypothetical protein